MQKELLSIRDVAEHCRVHPITVRRWVARGLLPARRVGPSLLRIRSADLDAMTAPIGGSA
ncbi:MAG: helix-turn-helix domain-containing protein [Mycobacterium sp.]